MDNVDSSKEEEENEEEEEGVALGVGELLLLLWLFDCEFDPPDDEFDVDRMGDGHLVSEGEIEGGVFIW